MNECPHSLLPFCAPTLILYVSMINSFLQRASWFYLLVRLRIKPLSWITVDNKLNTSGLQFPCLYSENRCLTHVAAMSVKLVKYVWSIQPHAGTLWVFSWCHCFRSFHFHLSLLHRELLDSLKSSFCNSTKALAYPATLFVLIYSFLQASADL